LTLDNELKIEKGDMVKKFTRIGIEKNNSALYNRFSSCNLPPSYNVKGNLYELSKDGQPIYSNKKIIGGDLKTVQDNSTFYDQSQHNKRSEKHQFKSI